VTRGYLALVLHAHLPYVRHPEHEHFLEEQWFFQAMTETYIPLAHVFEGLGRDGIDFRLTLSLSPPLAAMMRDPLLLDRYARQLDRLVELGHREVERTRGDGAFQPLAQMYRDRMVGVRDTFRRYEGDIPRALRAFQDAGTLELITCNATHMFLPLADRNWAVCHAQIELAAREHEQRFGRRPQGRERGRERAPTGTGAMPAGVVSSRPRAVIGGQAKSRAPPQSACPRARCSKNAPTSCIPTTRVRHSTHVRPERSHCS